MSRTAPSELSPYTGWTRQSWLELNDRLVTAVWSSLDNESAEHRLPGPAGEFGPVIDSLEAFARSMQMASFRLAGSAKDEIGAADWYARGLAEGTDPDSARAWPNPGKSSQARVEAASIALSFLLDRDRLWEPLHRGVKQQVIAWMETIIGAYYPVMNWVWFQIIVTAFLREVGGRWSAEELATSLAAHESLAVPGGWYHDEHPRSFDHYVGWAIQTYPILVAHLAPDLPGVSRLAPGWNERLHTFLSDAVHLVGADGSPLVQGRSLIYRFATAAPFWAGALADATPLSPGLTRRVTSGMLKHFIDAGVAADDDLLSVGWFNEFAPMKQSYSGSGSPYWAGIGMLGLMLPAEHPVWTATEEALPVELNDFDRAMPAPGWLVSGTRADGVVRVVNHGTDNSTAGSMLTDSIWYTRLSYSTTTAPDVATPGDLRPVDNEVVLLDSTGRSSARTGFETLYFGERVAVSRSRTHWVKPRGARTDHGAGRSGRVRLGPWLTVGSALHASVEIRACRVDEVLAGWPRSMLRPQVAPATLRISASSVVTAADEAGRKPHASIVNLAGLGVGGEQLRTGANQMGPTSSTQWLTNDSALCHARLYVAAIVLTAGAESVLPEVVIDQDTARVTVTWTDGLTDVIDLPSPPHPSQRRSE